MEVSVCPLDVRSETRLQTSVSPTDRLQILCRRPAVPSFFSKKPSSISSRWRINGIKLVVYTVAQIMKKRNRCHLWTHAISNKNFAGCILQPLWWQKLTLGDFSTISGCHTQPSINLWPVTDEMKPKYTNTRPFTPSEKALTNRGL